MKNKRCLIAFLGLLLLSCRQQNPATSAVKPRVLSEIRPAIRVIYPLSLIPGGIQSAEEFQHARASDQLLEAHYAEVGLLRPAVLTRESWKYASYRRGEHIFWTAQRIRVAAGESVFTDPEGNEIRGRCGNRLSETPREPIEFDPRPDLDTPQTEFEVTYLDAPPPFTPTVWMPPLLESAQLIPQYAWLMSSVRSVPRVIPELPQHAGPVSSAESLVRTEAFAHSLATPEPDLTLPLLGLLVGIGTCIRVTRRRIG